MYGVVLAVMIRSIVVMVWSWCNGDDGAYFGTSGVDVPCEVGDGLQV